MRRAERRLPAVEDAGFRARAADLAEVLADVIDRVGQLLKDLVLPVEGDLEAAPFLEDLGDHDAFGEVVVEHVEEVRPSGMVVGAEVGLGGGVVHVAR